MASFASRHVCVLLLVILLLSAPAAAFGAGNIASISKIEGKNWRHGDIEDTLKVIAFLRGRKWSSRMVKRVYFGNWLRDYSQAIDVGSLKAIQAESIRIIVWVLGFMNFNYATGAFEVTSERLGVYRPEEHIDNPKDYADNEDARKWDPRLRGPPIPGELAIDPNTGMKNYIANETGGPWATSSGYIKHSLARSIHFGRVYTHGSGNSRGNEVDLDEALRCLGQALHCFEDMPAHSNYCELVLREMGFSNVFPYTGTATQMNVRGKHVFPITTGTFGSVDFAVSVLGEVTDHFTQSEVDQVNTALVDAVAPGKRSLGGESSCSGLTDLLSQVPGTSGLCDEARRLQYESDAQAATMARGDAGFDSYSTTRASATHQSQSNFAAPPGSVGGPPGPGIPGMSPNIDPATIIPKIYPILLFRDNVVATISAAISKVPGLETLLSKINEYITVFVLSLLAPFIQPIIKAATQQLKQGTSAAIDSSGKHQYEPWTDPHCTDPTHSLLAKDHFSNILNEPAGQVAAEIVKYVAPRIVYAWEHPDVYVDEVLADVTRVFHHPALRDPRCELHDRMFRAIEHWVHQRPDRGASLNTILGSESVREGKNHVNQGQHHHGHGHGHAHGQGQAHAHSHSESHAHSQKHGTGTHNQVRGSAFEVLDRSRGLEPESSYPQQDYDFDSSSRPGSSYSQPDYQNLPQYYQSGFYGQQTSPAGYEYQQPAPAPAANYSANDSYTYHTNYQPGYEPYQQPQDSTWQEKQDYGDPAAGASGGSGWFSQRTEY